MNKVSRLFCVFLFHSVAFASGASAESNPPQTVPYVEISHYMGKWYELSRMPNSFQDNKQGEYGECRNTIAEYAVRAPSKLSVTNTCYRYNSKKEFEIDVAKAKASVVEDSGNSKLKVNFTGILILELLGIGNGNYWILGLGPLNKDNQYSWAFVGAPKRNFGWVLSRTKSLDNSEKTEINKLIVEKGYSLDSFKAFTDMPTADSD